MITILDFAKLALYAYKDPLVIKQFSGGNYLTDAPLDARRFYPNERPDGMYEVIVDNYVQSIVSQQHDFYASFFVKVEARRAIGAVVAIRGTVPTDAGNVEQDFESWWHSFFDSNARVPLPSIYALLALAFFDKVRSYNIKQLGLPANKVFVTGHSLGGAVAALLPTYYGVGARAVTFNAPGIYDVWGTNHKLYNHVINFRAQHDFVSALDYPIGPQIDFLVPEDNSVAAEVFRIAQQHQKTGASRLDLIHDAIETVDFFRSALDQHSMSNLLQAMESATDPGGGAPGVDTYGSLEAFIARVDANHKHFKHESPFLPVSAKAAA